MKIQGNLQVTGKGEKVNVQDVDGNPFVEQVTTIKFTNGSVTDNGDGTVTVATGGGTGGISVVDDGTSTYSGQTAMGISGDDFYFSRGTGGKPVINLRASASGVSDHGDLTGLGDDDHSQYIRVDGTRKFTGELQGSLHVAQQVHAKEGFYGGSGEFFTNLIVGDTGFENNSILVNTATFNASMKISDIGTTDGAQLHLHRHSSFIGLAPVIVASKTRSDTAAHIAVADDDLLFAEIATGWTSGTYAIATRIDHYVDGVPSGAWDDLPGRISFSTSAPGTSFPVEAMRIDSAQAVTFTNPAIGVTPTDPTHLTTKQYVDLAIGTGFYGIYLRESDGNPPTFRNDTIIFDSEYFYLHSDSIGKPTVSFRGVSGGSALTVREEDGAPTVSNVNTIRFSNSTVTDNGGGDVSVAIGSGGGISTLTEGSKSFGSQTVMGVNANHFYFSPGGSAGNKVLNLRYNKDIIPVFQELVSVSNFAVDTFAPYPYVIEQVEIDCKSGSCIAAFYIISAAARNLNGISVGGLDPINVSTTAATRLATGANTVNKGDCLLLSIPSNTTAKHLRIAITAKKPN